MDSTRSIKQKLRNMDSYDFEYFIADLWERRGWSTEVEQQSGDAGVDVRATKTSPYKQKVLIQAKRYGENTNVGGPEVQQYASLKQQESNVDTVIIVTSNYFTDSAQTRAEELNVKLININNLIGIVEDTNSFELIKSYTKKKLSSQDTTQRGTSSESAIVKEWSKSIYSSSGFSILGDSIYVMRPDGELTSINRANGNEEWSVNLTGELGGKDSIAVAENRIFVGSTDNHLYSIAQDGSEIWSFEADNAIRCHITICDGTIYFGTDGGVLYAVNANSGQKQWEFKTGGILHSAGKIFDGGTVSDRTLYFSAYLGVDKGDRIYSIDSESGSKNWSKKIRGASRNMLTTVYNGSVYLRKNNNIIALNAEDGKKQCELNINGVTDYQPQFQNGNMYIGNKNGQLYSFDLNNKKVNWRFECDDNESTEPSNSQISNKPTNGQVFPTIHHNIYVTNINGDVYCIKPDGNEIWKFRTDDRIITPPKIYEEILYIATGQELFSVNIQNE